MGGRGRGRGGDELKRLHHKTQLCLFERRGGPGSCPKGASCSFAHSLDELPAAARATYKTKMCFRMTGMGRCQYGAACHFAHSQEELRIPGAGAPAAGPHHAEGARGSSGAPAAANPDLADGLGKDGATTGSYASHAAQGAQGTNGPQGGYAAAAASHRGSANTQPNGTTAAATAGGNGRFPPATQGPGAQPQNVFAQPGQPIVQYMPVVVYPAPAGSSGEFAGQRGTVAYAYPSGQVPQGGVVQGQAISAEGQRVLIAGAEQVADFVPAGNLQRPGGFVPAGNLQRPGGFVPAGNVQRPGGTTEYAQGDWASAAAVAAAQRADGQATHPKGAIGSLLPNSLEGGAMRMAGAAGAAPFKPVAESKVEAIAESVLPGDNFEGAYGTETMPSHLLPDGLTELNEPPQSAWNNGRGMQGAPENGGNWNGASGEDSAAAAAAATAEAAAAAAISGFDMPAEGNNAGKSQAGGENFNAGPSSFFNIVGSHGAPAPQPVPPQAAAVAGKPAAFNMQALLQELQNANEPGADGVPAAQGAAAAAVAAAQAAVKEA